MQRFPTGLGSAVELGQEAGVRGSGLHVHQETKVRIEELRIVAYNTVELDLEKVFVRRINARVSCVLTS
jgi:hypothetical protein